MEGLFAYVVLAACFQDRYPFVRLPQYQYFLFSCVAFAFHCLCPFQGAQFPWSRPRQNSKNGYIESFNACLRDELRNTEILCTLAEVRENSKPIGLIIILKAHPAGYNTGAVTLNGRSSTQVFYKNLT